MAHLEETHARHLNGEEKNELAKQQPLEIDDDEEESFAYAMQLVTSTAASMSLQTAMELGLFDIIDRAGPAAKLSAEDIASQFACKNPDAASMLDRILRLLASHSVLRCSVVADENRSFRRLYSLAPVAKFFVRNDSGASLGPFIAIVHDKVSLDTWPALKSAILEGGIAFNRMFGVSVFDYMSSDSRYGEVFNKAMINQSTITMKKILESYKGFDAINTLVDVGGGLGLTLNLITSKYPHIQGINFDLPHVIQHAPSNPRVEHVKGDMFESVPKGDAIFMKWILHNWSDELCLKLLKNCYDALPVDGKVIVVDAVLPMIPETSASVKSISQFDVIMMTYILGGKERSEQEFMDLAASAGFNGVRFKCSVCNLCVMEFFK